MHLEGPQIGYEEGGVTQILEVDVESQGKTIAC